jgi:cell wall-associated NlpC family hydrolase/phage-related protein
MAGEIFVGEVAVGVVPDARHWNQRLRAELVPASQQVGQDMGKQISQNITKNVGPARTAVRGLTSDVDNLNRREAGVFERIANHVERIAKSNTHLTLFGKIWMGIGIATTIAEPAMAGLLVSVMGIGAGLGAAAMGIGAFGVAALGVFTKVGGALKQYTTAQEQLAKATTSAQRATAQANMAAATADLTQPQMRLFKALQQVRNEWKQFINDASPGVVGVAVKGLGLFPDILQLMNLFLPPVESALKVIIGELKTSLGGAGFFVHAREWASFTGPALISTFHIVRNLLSGITGLFRAFLPYTAQTMGGLENLTKKFRDWGQSMGPTHTGFNSLIQMFKTMAPIAGQTIANLAKALANFGGALTGLSGVGNSKFLLQFLLQFSQILAQLSENPWFTRIILYMFAFRSGIGQTTKILSLFAEPMINATHFVQGFANSAKAASAATGAAGTVGGGLRNFVKGISDSGAAASKSTGMLGTFGGAIRSSGSAIFGFIKNVISWFSWSKIVTAATKVWTVVQAGLNIVMSMNPIALIVIAIAALVAAIVILWTKSAAFRNFWKTVWNFVWDIIKSVWNWIKGHWPLLLAILTGPIGLAVLWIIKHWNTVKNYFIHAWDAVVNIWHSVWNGLSSFFGRIWAGWKNTFNTLVGWFKTIWDAVKNAWNTVWNNIKTVITTPMRWVINVVWNPITGAINKFLSFVGIGTRIPQVTGLATGGKIPGYGGGDVVPALLEPGETVVPKHLTTDPGFQAWAKANDIPGFQLGGIIGAAKAIANTISPGAGDLLSGALPDFSKWLNAIANIPSAGGWSSALAKMPEQLVGNFVSWAGNHVRSFLDKILSTAFGGAASSSAIVKYAMQYVGKVPYVWGGTTPAGWDCSGFTSWVYHHFGIPAPRTSQAQQMWAVPSGDIPGALVFFYGTGGSASHVGLNIGGGKMINAYGTGYGTIVSPSHMGGFSGFGMPPGKKKFDNGGIWPPGAMGINMTPYPEVVLNSGQWSDLHAAASGGDGASAAMLARLDRLIAVAEMAPLQTAAGVGGALNSAAGKARRSGYYGPR